MILLGRGAFGSSGSMSYPGLWGFRVLSSPEYILGTTCLRCLARVILTRRSDECDGRSSSDQVSR
jgi:hypothetical protein